MRHWPILGIALVLTVLAGCGQKGPLYLPGDEQAAERYDRSGEYEEADTDAAGRDNGDDSGDDTGTAGEDEG